MGIFCVFGGERREDGVVWDVDGGEFELGFLVESSVRGGSVSAEAVEEVLFFLLGYGGGERREGREEVVGYAERLLGFGGERGGEGNAVELGRTARYCFSLVVV